MDVRASELYNLLEVGSENVNQEKSRLSPTETSDLQTAGLPFADAPNQTKLFLEYQTDSLALLKYYPSAVASPAQISERIPEVLAEYKTDRDALCDCLEAANADNKAALTNINLLREKDCVAVVTGQQAGLFTGALYTIYKALSAVKSAEDLRARGFKAVPVFWVATEDHDFDEVRKTEIVNRGGELFKVDNKPDDYRENLSVGNVLLDETINRTIKELFDNLPRTEFTGETKNIIETAYAVDENYGGAFARLLSVLTKNYGLIILNPLDERLKKLAAPVYREAVKKSDEIVSALINRSEELKKDGYHAQVLITPDYFPLFWQAADGTRNQIKKTVEGNYKVKNIGKEFSLKELSEIAAREPERFSPSVVLRSVVQDYLLPTVCYFGGAAEVAYFAQSSEVYRILNRPATTVFHRQSFTIIESRHAKTLRKYDLRLKDLFAGKDSILPRVVEKYLNRELAETFSAVEENINEQLNILGENLADFDSTLSENLASRRRKIIYHVDSLRGKFHREQARKDETVTRQIESALHALAPHKNLQERALNITQFLNFYGMNIIDWIYAAIDLEDKEHRIIYL